MTLFTLRNDIRKGIKRDFFIYLGVVLFCALFGFVYELFSHGVISNNMLFGFVIPLVGGFLPYSLFIIFKKVPYFSIFTSYALNSAIATLTVGSYFKGVLDIYGTSRDYYFNTYMIIGFALLGVAIISYIVSLILNKSNKK